MDLIEFSHTLSHKIKQLNRNIKLESVKIESLFIIHDAD